MSIPESGFVSMNSLSAAASLQQETCEFLREETRDEDSPTKRVTEVQVGGVAFGCWPPNNFWLFIAVQDL